MRLPSILNAVHETPLVALPKLSARLDRHLFLKLESANPTGSMKDRVALHCIDKAIERKRIVPGDVIVESTSGCLGISLAMVGRHRGFHVICVIDPKTTTASRVLMRSFGAEVIEVSGADPYGNYLQARLNKVPPRENLWVSCGANRAVVRESGGICGRWIRRSIAAPANRSDTAVVPPSERRGGDLRRALS